MEEFYQAIEAGIRASGYQEPVSGEEIYQEICDQMDEKEPGAYIFMSKITGDTFFEYNIQIFEDQFNLSSIDIHSNGTKYHADFD
ncbi:hypothetical protein [Clostridium sp. E02]|uniref:hypothetical protein n=1 Tax=Clostridium sp. E02 TaxID=2487134 RepID=UPI000F52A0A0|nr:hypothetical protein [Clostridium sp. E02]